MQHCQQMEQNCWLVPSDSKPSKKYTVTAFKGEPPTCTCVAFAIGRNRGKSNKRGAKPGRAWCKHIEYVYDTVCQWDSDSDKVQLEPGVCPMCGGPTAFDDDDQDIPEITTETAALDSLKSMIAEIEAKTE